MLPRVGKDPQLNRGKLLFRTPERWQSGRMRRFAKPPSVLPLQSSQQLTCGSKCSQMG
jgi:hypothetical protein